MGLPPPRRQAPHSCSRPVEAQGFLLPLAVVVALLITLGSVALVLRGAGALVGSTRQQRSREALAIAEAGMEQTIAALNLSHPFLLTNNHLPASGQCWAADGGSCSASTASFPARLCRSMTNAGQSAIPLAGSVSDGSGVIGDWRVVAYTFRGDRFFGGSGTLRVEGLRRSGAAAAVLARSQVEQEMSVRIKDCVPSGLNTVALLAIRAPMQVNQTKIYALTAEQVAAMANDANNDGVPDVVPPPVITPTQPAAAHCIDCTSLAQLNIGTSAVGLWSFGPMPYPPVPTAPTSLVAWDMLLKANDPPRSRQIWAGQNRSEGGWPVCLVDAAGITHCRIRRIRIQGNESNTLKIVYPPSRSASRQVRLYIEGDVTLSGNSRICQAVYTGSPYPATDSSVDPPCLDNPELTGLNSSFYGLRSRDLLIFGNPDCSINQNLTLNGGPQTLHLFAYVPCSDVTINGGSSTPDIYGAVWAKTYTPSGSQNVDIWVPPDLSSDLETIYGGSFTITLRRPVALGSNRWSSYESVP